MCELPHTQVSLLLLGTVTGVSVCAVALTCAIYISVYCLPVHEVSLKEPLPARGADSPTLLLLEEVAIAWILCFQLWIQEVTCGAALLDTHSTCEGIVAICVLGSVQHKMLIFIRQNIPSAQCFFFTAFKCHDFHFASSLCENTILICTVYCVQVSADTQTPVLGICFFFNTGMLGVFSLICYSDLGETLAKASLSPSDRNVGVCCSGSLGLQQYKYVCWLFDYTALKFYFAPSVLNY